MFDVTILNKRGEPIILENYIEDKKYSKELIYPIISNILNKSGFTPHLSGYKLIIQAVFNCYITPDNLIGKTKILYPALADYNHTNASNVERNIRTAIKSAWTKCGGNNFYLRMGCGFIESNKQPTCGEFIDIITEYLNCNFGVL